MKFTLLAILAFVLIVSSVQCFSLRQLFGTCVERCSSDADCATGTHCRSNGCGHTCQKTSLTGLKTCFNAHMALCDLWCPSGQFAKDANGCPLCRCDNTLGSIVAQ
ncbi:anosmin-1-like [Littorina saxatilis]|uniref:Antistasin-like domain-containing protein n=1 Tax=Littorina saxatilis TaxID=31220 RepID=A0AAN9AY10_9CAEN